MTPELKDVVVHDSPADVADWAETAEVTAVLFGDGVNIEFTKEHGPNRWPDFTPAGWTGPIEYTVWPVVQVNGQWHTAGIIQMWENREWTGAPLLTEWHEWAYAPDRWGPLVDYRPRAGDTIGFFVTAGNARDEHGVTSVRERSNVLFGTLSATGGFEPSAPTPSPVVPVPVPPAPVPVVLEPSPDVIAAVNLSEAKVLAAIADLRQHIDSGIRQIGDTYLPLLVKVFGAR